MSSGEKPLSAAAEIAKQQRQQREGAAPVRAEATPYGIGSGTSWRPPSVTRIEETGLNELMLAELALKILYSYGYLSGYQIAEHIALPFTGIVDRVIEFLKREKLIDFRGAGGLGEAGFQYLITEAGAGRAREAMERSQYVGPAPVRIERYSQAIRQQHYRVPVNPELMQEALKELVVPQSVFEKVGPAVNSGRSIFLYGPPGNGKTTIAEAVGRLVLGQGMYIPYAVYIDGQIVSVFDSINHEPIPDTMTSETSDGKPDPRWIRIRRPVIMVGGELTLDGLDLVWDETAKFYEAPFQVKANGGMFLIDDFGRQLVRPRDLLNRWIVPLEKRADFLTLHTGRKIEVPFDVLIVFSTNLEPRDLVDEAFLRRIRHKIDVIDPSFEEFRLIFQRVAQARALPYDERGLAYLLQEWYIKYDRPMRSVHPRDLIDQMKDISSYLGIPFQMTQDLIDRACQAYFVEL